MPETAIAICARALVNLGARPIQTLSVVDGGDDNVITCANAYPPLRRGIIASYPWNCMTVKQSLTKESGSPVGQWKNSFVIPGEALAAPHAIYTDAGSRLAISEYEVFARRVMTNYPALIADFTVEKDESEWPSWFASMMVSCLCAEIAYAVTDQQSVVEHWSMRAYGTPSEGGMGGELGKSMTLDAQSSGNIGINADYFVNARMGFWG